MRERLNIAFFGTSEFGRIILEGLIRSGYKPILVATAPDKPAGRKQIMTPSPVKILAQQNNIPVTQPQKLSGSDPDSFKKQINLIVVAAYGKVIPKKILDIPKYGAINVHPSLLPRWRGPSPIQYSILNGDMETGVTIMMMDEELDHGPLLAQRKLNPAGSDPAGLGIRTQHITADELSAQLASLGAELLVETIPKWINGKIKPKKQNHKKATYSKSITKEDGHINWQKSAEEIERQIRAFTPWPGSFTFWSRISAEGRNNIRIKITEASVGVKPQQKLPLPGQVLSIKKEQFGIQTKKGVLAIEKLQPEGKKEVAAKQFLNGHPDIIGKVLK